MAAPQGWSKLYDDAPEHPKFVAAGHKAGWLYVCGQAYASKHETDGTIPKAMVPRLSDVPSPMRQAAVLVKVGLWHDRGDHFEQHDYAEMQTTASEREEARRQARDRKRRSRGSHSDVTRDTDRDSHSPSRDSSATEVEVEVEVENKSKPLAPDKPARKPDPIWDAVMDACGIDQTELTATARGAYNKAVKELRAIGATPDGIYARAKLHLSKWPDVSLTPSSLAKNYAQLAARPNGRASPKSAASPPEVGSVEWEARRRESEARADAVLGGSS